MEMMCHCVWSEGDGVLLSVLGFLGGGACSPPCAYGGVCCWLLTGVSPDPESSVERLLLSGKAGCML